MSRAIEIVSRSPPARCHGQIRAGHLKHLTGIVTFAQYRHFFEQFQSGYLTHRLLILLV
jgi:hypothetical protein